MYSFQNQFLFYKKTKNDATFFVFFIYLFYNYAIIIVNYNCNIN